MLHIFPYWLNQLWFFLSPESTTCEYGKCVMDSLTWRNTVLLNVDLRWTFVHSATVDYRLPIVSNKVPIAKFQLSPTSGYQLPIVANNRNFFYYC